MKLRFRCYTFANEPSCNCCSIRTTGSSKNMAEDRKGNGSRYKSRTLSFSRKRTTAVTKRGPSLQDENAQLQLMLQQALKREAETLRKLKHMSDTYHAVVLQRRTCPINSDLNSTCRLSDEDDGQCQVQVASPQLIIDNESEVSLCTPPEESYHMNGDAHNTISPKESATTSLAPLPLGLRDIRLEREKPPTATLMHTHIHAVTSLDDDNHNQARQAQRSISDEHLHTLVTHTKSVPEQKQQHVPALVFRPRSNSFWKKTKARVNPGIDLEELFRKFHLRSRLQVDSLSQYLKCDWWDLMAGDVKEVSKQEVKYREVVWELFQEEVKYLTSKLQPLELVYKGFLEELQFHRLLDEASVDRIFGNISELSELSCTVARDLLKLFDRRKPSMVAEPNELVLSFSMFGHKFNPVYKRFCTNFEEERGYIKVLENNQTFTEYLRICRTAPMVQKSSLSDLLIAPMQHQVHYQLILEKVLKYTHNPNHRAVLSSTIKAFVVSLKELESAIAQHKCSLELLELQEMLYWPPLQQICSDSYIPPNLSSRLHSQPCEHILASASRHIELKSTLKMVDQKGRAATDVLCVLFNDLLLLAEVKSHSNKKHTVMNQPIPLSQLLIYDDISSPRPVFTVISLTPLGQQVAIFTFLCSSSHERQVWISKLNYLGLNTVGQ